MGIPFIFVDAFTDQAFGGNPAVICLLETWPGDRWLQNVAREMNQSETAFVVRNAEGFDLRWFTPKVEVDLCGHATLAAAHAIWQEGLVQTDQVIAFSTRSGTLTAVRRRDEVELDFPLTPATPADAPPEMIKALSIDPIYVGKTRFDYLLEVKSEHELRGLRPDFRLLSAAPARGIIVTSRSCDPRYDFASRFFAPSVGIDEDPVTGSAHCCLGDYWQKRLGRNEMTAYQASSRGGALRVRVEPPRVFLSGQAVTVAKGELTEQNR